MYNKNKPNFKRWGISLFSLDGSDSGEIDLNSLAEYNHKNGTKYDETHFNTPTKHWKNLKDISEPFKPIEKYIGRSHFIKLDDGGYFPPHRDLGNTFRLISFFNCSHESLYFILDGKRVAFEKNILYFADTRRNHSVFSFQPNAYMLVFNIAINPNTINFVVQNLQQR